MAATMGRKVQNSSNAGESTQGSEGAVESGAAEEVSPRRGVSATAMLGRSPVATLLLDVAQDRWVYSNAAARALLGYQHKSLRGLGVAALSRPPTARVLQIPMKVRAYLEVALRGQVSRGDLFLYDARGRKRWLEGHFSSTEREVERPRDAGRLVTCVLVDVERSRLTSRKHADSAELLRLVLSSTNEGFWDWDIPSGRVFFSDQWLDNLGYEPGALPQRVETWQDLIHPDDVEHAEEVLASRLAGTAPIHYSENRLRTKSGEFRWFADRGRVVERSTDGTALRMVGTDTDITDLKAAWEGKRRAEARLAQSERLASVGMMAAGVAHEINNPLAYVLNNLEYALGQLDRDAIRHLIDPEVFAALREAQEGADRVRAIVRDLRTFSRMGDERQDWSDPREALESSIKIAKQQILQRAQLVVDCQPTPQVHANPARLGQVFLNLIVNAYESITPGDPENNCVSISCRRDGGAVEVSVSDTGSGIADKDVPRIFDLFYTTKPVGVGTGLGLSICHSLVEAFGGTLQVETQLGIGTTFRVRLPHTLSESGMWPAPEASAWDAVHRVLVVDPDPQVARSLDFAIGKQGKDIVACENALALGELRKAENPSLREDARGFDLVLCNGADPESGLSLLESAMVEGLGAARRFVFLTNGPLGDQHRQRLRELGAPAVSKPLDARELGAVVEKVAARTALRLERIS